jgi:hypothetical protein
MLLPQKKGAAGDFLSARSHHCFCFCVCARLFRASPNTLRGNDFPPGEATPVNGSFSVRFPIPYWAIAHTGEVPEAALAVQVLTGVTPEGLRFSASERPVQQPVPPIESFLETMKRRPDAVASEVRHEQKGDLEILSFSLSEPKQEHFFRTMRNKTTGYVLVVQFPIELRSKAIEMKDDFFGSFKIIPH